MERAVAAATFLLHRNVQHTFSYFYNGKSLLEYQAKKNDVKIWSKAMQCWLKLEPATSSLSVTTSAKHVQCEIIFLLS